jgi:acetyltransferase-like isoleucine patch superfamily enzyme
MVKLNNRIVNESTTDTNSLVGKLKLDTPWKFANEMKRFALLPLVRLIFWMSGVKWGTDWKIYGLPIIQKHRRGRLTIGDRLQLRSTSRSNPLGPHHPVILSVRDPGASLIIGDDFGMTGGSIVAQQSIRIGHRVAVGANSIICDTDFHPLHRELRRDRPNTGKAAPILIEDDVFIGMQCLILKGVTIGSGSVIGAGSVVIQSIPAGVIAAGNPARVIRPIDAPSSTS